MMAPSGCICIFAFLALTQADLRNYNNLLHHDHNINQVPPKSVVQPSGSNVEKMRNEARNEMNEDLNLVGDDRIPLDYDINPKLTNTPAKSLQEKLQGMGHTLLNCPLTNIALGVFKETLLNQANPPHGFANCLVALTNIMEEEHLFAEIKNLTISVLKIVQKAGHLFLQCQEKESPSQVTYFSCVKTVANAVGADLITASNDLEKVVLSAVAVAEKSLSQLELCVLQSEVPLADLTHYVLHLLNNHFDSKVKKDEEVREEPKLFDDRIVGKKNPVFFKDNNWIDNTNIVI